VKLKSLVETHGITVFIHLLMHMAAVHSKLCHLKSIEVTTIFECGKGGIRQE
jgi:hypothetical protein